MLLYSQTITSFLKKIKARSRVIMAQEMGLILKTERFSYQGYSYPLNFVCFEDPKKLGFFDPSCMQLGLNYQLMLQARDEVIDNTLRHELAHLYTYLLNPKTFNEIDAHGAHFRNTCEKFSWGENVFLSKANLKEDNSELDQFNHHAKKFEQVKKLMALASSSNEHEAQAATLKANQLLRKYNLEYVTNVSDQEEVSYVKTVLTKKQNGPILVAIYEILHHFYVRTVFSKRNGQMSLEVVGHKNSVLLADYVAKFLDSELEKFWSKAKKENTKLRGISAKKSYIRGVAAGFINKITKDQSSELTSSETALLSISLDQLTKLAYPKLKLTSAAAGKTNKNALKAGIKHGRELSIRQGVTNNNQTKLLV